MVMGIGEGEMTRSQILQFVISGITQGSIYAMVALGFTIIFRTTRIVNFAQGDFVMFGAMLVATLHNLFHISLLPSILLSILIVAMIGGAMEITMIYPLKGVGIFPLVMITLGASIIFNSSSLLIWGVDPLHLKGFSGDNPIRFYGATLMPQTLWIVGAIVCVAVALFSFFRYTKIGQAMLACSMNDEAAASVGINVRMMVLSSFILSAALGGLGGVLIVPITMVMFDMGVLMTLKGFAAAILGGLGSAPGAVVGGIVLGLAESLSCGIVSSGYRDSITLFVLILVLLVRPSGILGSRFIKR
ncbi:MAG: branched-chain amino acid ABC transporter permease [Deltaproteobacteria bacterium]|nr:branched-chain amino acid ABC transporter permease [Deltaproteobacteria bacterium]